MTKVEPTVAGTLTARLVTFYISAGSQVLAEYELESKYADAERNGDVTTAEIIIVQSNFTGPQPTPPLPPTFFRSEAQGAPDADGDVDTQDYLTAYQNFTGPLTPKTPELSRYFIYGSYVDEPVAMVTIDDTTTPPTETSYHYYLRNALYSIAALATDDGVIVERYGYDAYGNTTFHDVTLGTILASVTKSALGNPYLYTGRRFDDETGLYYYRARYYDPVLARFISRDPIGYGDGPNVYQYVGGHALVATDPSGAKGFIVDAPYSAEESTAKEQYLAEINGRLKHLSIQRSRGLISISRQILISDVPP